MGLALLGFFGVGIIAAVFADVFGSSDDEHDPSDEALENENENAQTEPMTGNEIELEVFGPQGDGTSNVPGTALETDETVEIHDVPVELLGEADDLTNLTIEGGKEADEISGGNENDLLIGNAGDDTIEGHEGSDEIIGGDGNDELYGGEVGDWGYGGGDDDFENTLLGGDGDDTLVAGGQSDDLLFGGNGDDVLVANFGSSSLFGGDGNDLLRGSDASDYMSGGDGDDTVSGNDGDDTLSGGNGDDTITGGRTGIQGGIIGDRDELIGGGGNDLLSGVGHDDTMYGDEGNDTLDGGHGRDFLDGGAGDDHLIVRLYEEYPDTRSGVAAYSGSDTLTGGEGSDTFTIVQNKEEFAGLEVYTPGEIEAPYITDFDATEDVLVYKLISPGKVVDDLDVELVDWDDMGGADLIVDGEIVARISGASGLNPSAIVLLVE